VFNNNNNNNTNTRWFKYDRDDLCVKKSQFVPVIFEPPCNNKLVNINGLVGYRTQGEIEIILGRKSQLQITKKVTDSTESTHS
jgi:hypothetical protein